jgi:hypothetical protein
MKTLLEYSGAIQQSQTSPDLLADLLSEMSVHYAYLSEQHIKYKMVKADWENKAKFYTDNGKTELEKPLSDKAVENKWRRTKQGKEEYKMRSEIKVLEKLMSNLRSILSQRKAEAQSVNYGA